MSLTRPGLERKNKNMVLRRELDLGVDTDLRRRKPPKMIYIPRERRLAFGGLG
jgi:hypothetical protein